VLHTTPAERALHVFGELHHPLPFASPKTFPKTTSSSSSSPHATYNHNLTTDIHSLNPQNQLLHHCYWPSGDREFTLNSIHPSRESQSIGCYFIPLPLSHQVPPRGRLCLVSPSRPCLPCFAVLFSHPRAAHSPQPWFSWIMWYLAPYYTQSIHRKYSDPTCFARGYSESCVARRDG
jgi:hypothetical protein